MANRIIKIQSKSVPKDELEVYRDIDSDSVRTDYPKPSSDDEYKYIKKLAIERIAKLNTGEELSNRQVISTRAQLDDESIREIYFYYTQFNDFETSLNLWLQNSRYKITRDINVLAVRNSLNNIFSWIPGERIINPEFGCKLYKYLYEGITDFNIEQIIAEVKRLVTQWEPRVEIDSVVNVSDINETEDNTVHLEIIYRIPELSNEQYMYSFVYNRNSD